MIWLTDKFLNYPNIFFKNCICKINVHILVRFLIESSISFRSCNHIKKLQIILRILLF